MTACTKLQVAPLTLTAVHVSEQLWEIPKQLLENPLPVRVYFIKTKITFIYLNITFNLQDCLSFIH